MTLQQAGCYRSGCAKWPVHIFAAVTGYVVMNCVFFLIAMSLSCPAAVGVSEKGSAYAG